MSTTIHEVGPQTPLPVESPEAVLQALIHIYVGLHTKSQELFGSLSQIDLTSDAYLKRSEEFFACNDLAVEAQMQVTYAMREAGVWYVDAGEWHASLEPVNGARFVAARIERKVA